MHVPENNPFALSFHGLFFSFRFSPMVFLYLSTVIPSIWVLELSLLQSKAPANSSLGPELHLLAHLPITAVGVPPPACPPRSHMKASPQITKDLNLARGGWSVDKVVVAGNVQQPH